MVRYIDAEKLRETSFVWMDGNILVMSVQDVDNAPTADVVEVVRCKDCKYCEESDVTNRIFCTYQDTDFETYPNDFCSHGERRTNND